MDEETKELRDAAESVANFINAKLTVIDEKYVAHELIESCYRFIDDYGFTFDEMKQYIELWSKLTLAVAKKKCKSA